MISIPVFLSLHLEIAPTHLISTVQLVRPGVLTTDVGSREDWKYSGF
jgi:hypothetical protein